MIFEYILIYSKIYFEILWNIFWYTLRYILIHLLLNLRFFNNDLMIFFTGMHTFINGTYTGIKRSPGLQEGHAFFYLYRSDQCWCWCWWCFFFHLRRRSEQCWCWCLWCFFSSPVQEWTTTSTWSTTQETTVKRTGTTGTWSAG